MFADQEYNLTHLEFEDVIVIHYALASLITKLEKRHGRRTLNDDKTLFRAKELIKRLDNA